MSRVKTRKEIKEELDEVNAQLEASHVNHAEDVKALQETIAQAEQALLDADAKYAELLAEKEEAELQFAESEKENAQLVEFNEKLIEANSEFEKEIERQKAALADPAFVDATVVKVEVDQAVEDAEADAQEANPAEEIAEPKNEAEQWEAMEAGPARQAFWNEHKRLIIKQINSRD